MSIQIIEKGTNKEITTTVYLLTVVFLNALCGNAISLFGSVI